jgi:monoamine oxidase
MSEEQRSSFAAVEVNRVMPGLQDVYETGMSKCWDDDEWARGAFAFCLPGQATTLTPAVARVEGRIHFAGEHTSALTGWMQGALESGLRAAREVNER